MATKEYNMISISKFKATCLELLQKVYDTQQELLITKNNVPIALVVPPPILEEKKSSFGAMKDYMEIDPDLDLTEPTADLSDWEVHK